MSQGRRVCCFAQVAAVNGVHTHEVGAGQVRAARLMLGGYLERFKARLAPRNAQRVQTLLVVAGRLLGAMGCTADGPQAADQQAQGGEAAVAGAALRVNDFLFGAQLDGVNFFELLAWYAGNECITQFRIQVHSNCVWRCDPTLPNLRHSCCGFTWACFCPSSVPDPVSCTASHFPAPYSHSTRAAACRNMDDYSLVQHASWLLLLC